MTLWPTTPGVLANPIVEAVARSSKTQIDELPKLNAAIDPEALDALFAPSRSPGTVVFESAAHEITVVDGEVSAEPINDA